MHPYIYILIIQVIMENMNQALEMLKKNPQKHKQRDMVKFKTGGVGVTGMCLC